QHSRCIHPPSIPHDPRERWQLVLGAVAALRDTLHEADDRTVDCNDADAAWWREGTQSPHPIGRGHPPSARPTATTSSGPPYLFAWSVNLHDRLRRSPDLLAGSRLHLAALIVKAPAGTIPVRQGGHPTASADARRPLVPAARGVALAGNVQGACRADDGRQSFHGSVAEGASGRRRRRGT